METLDRENVLQISFDPLGALGFDSSKSSPENLRLPFIKARDIVVMQKDLVIYLSMIIASHLNGVENFLSLVNRYHEE